MRDPGDPSHGGEAVLRTATALRAIHEITTVRDLDFPEQVRAILELGRKQFGLPFGAVARLDGDKLEVRYLRCPGDELTEGALIDVCNTFCYETLRTGEVHGISDASVSRWSDHPARGVMGLQAYLGAPIHVDGRPWGTLCFFDMEPRETAFSDADFDLLALCTQRVQAGLAQLSTQRRLEAVFEGTAAVTGEGFFRSMVRHLAQALGVTTAFVAECNDDRSVARTLAFWHDGSFQENHEYDLAGAPCEAVATEGLKIYPERLAALFPDRPRLREMNLESFAGIAIHDSAGNVIGHLAAFDDRKLQLGEQDRWILEIFATRAGAEMVRLSAERALREREQRYELATTAARVGVWDLDVHTGAMFVDSSLATLVGIEHDRLPSSVKQWLALVHPDDRDRVEAEAWAHIKGRSDHYRSEYRMLHRSGETRWVHVEGRTVRRPDGRAARMAGTRMDITDRKRLEGVIRNVAEGVSATTGCAFFSSLAEYLARALDVRTAFVCAVAPDETDCRFLSVWHDGAEFSDNDCLSDDACRAIFAADVFHASGEAASVFPALDDRPLESLMAIGLLDAAGGSLGVLGVVDDRSLPDEAFAATVLRIFAARAAAELERLRSTEEQLALERQIVHTEKLKSLGVLAGGIAHDFNNLLTGILGNAALAQMRLPVESAARSKIEKIEQAARRAEGLTQQMLAYSGRGAFVVSNIQIDEVVDEMSDLLDTAVSRAVTLRRDFADDLPPVEADTTQLRQIVMNLIMNASDSLGDEPGVIVLRTGVETLDEASIADYSVKESLDAGRYVFVEVEDTGTGMSPETRRRMFDPFFTTKFHGRGLGLSAVLGIVNGHRGGILVDSDLDHGTRLRVVLPAASKGLEIEERAEERTEPWKTRAMILIVDDEVAVRDVIQATVEMCGMRALLAADGEQGVDLFRRHRSEIALVLMDLTMPRLDGCTAAAQIRRLAPEMPILLMSGYNEQEATRRFARDGLSGFIHKPFQPSAMLAHIKSILR